MVARSLAGAIWGMRVVRRRLVEGRIGRPEGAEDFVGRDVQEAEFILGRAFKAPPVPEGGLEELEGAGDVGGDELARAVNRAVDVRLGSEVHDRLRRSGGEGPSHSLGIANIGLDEGEAPLALQVGKGGQVAGVGQPIDHRDTMAGRNE